MTQKPLRILFHSWSLGGGGAERVFAVLASGLAQRGHDVIFSVEADAEHNVSFLDPAVRRYPSTGGRIETVKQLVQLFREEKPDVSLSAISACNLRHAIAACMAGRRHRAIMTYHGHASAEPEISNQMGYWATPATTRLMARTVAVSDGLREHIVRDWWGSAAKTIRIYNPTATVAAHEAAQTEAELLARPPTVLSIGSFLPRKNFLALIQAFARVRTPDARLVILGEGKMRGELEAEIARLKLTDRVSLPGYLTKTSDIFHQSRCFAFASREESFGLVLVEALAQGLPVVVTPSDGPNEILENGRYGDLVPHDDPDAMAAAIDRRLANPGDPSIRLARAAEYSVPTGLDAYEALIRQVVDEAERAGH